MPPSKSNGLLNRRSFLLLSASIHQLTSTEMDMPFLQVRNRKLELWPNENIQFSLTLGAF